MGCRLEPGRGGFRCSRWSALRSRCARGSCRWGRSGKSRRQGRIRGWGRAWACRRVGWGGGSGGRAWAKAVRGPGGWGWGRWDHPHPLPRWETGVGGGVGAELPQAAMRRSAMRRVVMGRRSLVGGMVSLVYAEGPHPIPFLRPFDSAHASAHLRQGERNKRGLSSLGRGGRVHGCLRGCRSRACGRR